MISRLLPWAVILATIFTAAMIGSSLWAYLIMGLGYLAGRLWPRHSVLDRNTLGAHGDT